MHVIVKCLATTKGITINFKLLISMLPNKATVLLFCNILFLNAQRIYYGKSFKTTFNAAYLKVLKIAC